MAFINAAELVKQATTASHLVYDAVNFPLFHSLLDALSCLHHRLRDFLGGTGGKTEDVVFAWREKDRVNVTLCVVYNTPHQNIAAYNIQKSLG